MKTYILLENIVFYANHGVFNQERIVGNEYIVSLKIDVDLTKSCISDNLDDTISYAQVYELVKQEMQISSKLLENIAYRIIRALRDAFSQIETIEVKVSKRNPPMGAQLDAASVVIID